jgi:hypothetical protein
MPRTLLTAASSAGTAALLLFAVSACGGGSTPSNASPTSGAQPTQTAVAGGAAAGQGFPGASGKVAAISGKTLQVQSASSGQVAVTYTAKTTFTEAVKATASAVKVGSCVNVRSTDEQAGVAAATGPVTAASVQLSPPVDGACGARGLAGAGTDRNGGGFTPPTGRPSGTPGAGSGPGARTRGGGFAGARPVSGEVTAVDGSRITVAAMDLGETRVVGSTGSTTATPSAKPTTTPVVVTTTAATTYTKTVTASAKDLAVGQCVTAVGTANDTGAVTASFIASQPAVNGECATGFSERRTGVGSGGTS